MTTPYRSDRRTTAQPYKRGRLLPDAAAKLMLYQIDHWRRHGRCASSTEVAAAGVCQRAAAVRMMARMEASFYFSRAPGGSWSTGWPTPFAEREEGRIKAGHVSAPYRRRRHVQPNMFAIVDGVTIFPKSVEDPSLAAHVLMPGKHTAKLGGRVEKGRWAGLPIYYLTLEERATCPRSCKVWDVCYGNNMHRVKRWSHADLGALTDAIERDLAAIHPASTRVPEGLVVRLHELGDFFSLEYVDWWRGALGRWPGLRVFGFTAWPPDSEIGAAVDALNRDYADRWHVRFSHRPEKGRHGAAVVFPGMPEPEGVRCPEQTGRTENCGTCGLCWAMDKAVVFAAH